MDGGLGQVRFTSASRLHSALASEDLGARVFGVCSSGIGTTQQNRPGPGPERLISSHDFLLINVHSLSTTAECCEAASWITRLKNCSFRWAGTLLTKVDEPLGSGRCPVSHEKMKKLSSARALLCLSFQSAASELLA
jgi:hypothetical protein